MEHFTRGSGFYRPAFQKLSDGFLVNPLMMRNGSASTSSLILDSERDELVEAPVKVERKAPSAERSAAALKNHSEAERRRRARINAHLGTLRTLVPGGKKMDKATLLAEVISHLKVLKRTAMDAGESFVIPQEIDEVTVEEQKDGFRASLCCDYKPGLLADLRQALDALHLIIKRAEIATLDGRMKNVFLFTCCKEGIIEDDEVRRFLVSSVQQAIRNVLNKFSISEEFPVGNTISNKRYRISIFNSSSSSSVVDYL